MSNILKMSGSGEKIYYFLHVPYSSGFYSVKPSGARWEAEPGCARSLLGLRLTCLPVEDSVYPRRVRTFCLLPILGLSSLWMLGSPLLSSASASLCWPLHGPLMSVPSVFPSDKGICTSIHVTTGKVHQESKGCTRLLRFLCSSFHIWAEKPQNCTSLLHHWLLAAANIPHQKYFLSLLDRRANLGAEKQTCSGSGSCWRAPRISWIFRCSAH